METLTLTELGARMARRWRTLLGGALVGLALGATVQLLLPTRYVATTVVHVEAADPDTVDMAAEQAVATSRRVTAEALDALADGGLTIGELEGSTDAVAVKDSRLLRITCTAGAARAATRGADAVAQAYLAARAVDAAQGEGRPVVEGVVVDPARTPRAPSGPGLLSTALGGAVLGLLVSAPVASAQARGVSRSPAGRAS